MAEAQLDEVVARVGELGRQLTELSPGRRLYSFLADRAHGDAYTSNLGLISIIRKDFEQLVDLMADWRRNPTAQDGTVRQPIDRIVLYIDDLDRCSSQQVVEVLQAVHLLLALDLFVVVVGVDPRWLLRSLSSHYDEILQHSDGSNRLATPEDYLEKILNIPMVLPGMTPGSLSKLLRSMIDEASPVVTDPAPVAEAPPGIALTTYLPEIPIEPGSELDAQDADPYPAPPRPLGDDEIAMLAALDPLIGTPREAKRLMNLYRMLRSTRDLSEASRFLGDDGHPGEYQAVIVLLGLLTAHSRLLGQILDTSEDQEASRLGGLMHRPPDTPWPQFVDDLRPRITGNTWTNPIRGHIVDGELRHWIRLHNGMTRISSLVTVADLELFQLWTPRIRRFSYILSPTS
ncbi:P-loop NTPase fold protein [Actinophytocola glycyrrhizae]|uniref:P-loop NTPase fold protein n=1 Tax=Actinophytocola glycyrrhizae TaxID=2044873 RepID=A0ABV9S4Y2_9PSEU